MGPFLTAHSVNLLLQGEAIHMPVRLNRVVIKELFRRFPVHPFFLAAYPIISLLAFNIDQVFARDALKSLVICLSTTALVLIGLRMRSRNWQLAGLLTSLLVVWFFVYGRLYVPLKGVSVFGFVLGRHRYLLFAWSCIVIAAAIWLMKRQRVFPDSTRFLNIFSTILICLPILQIGVFYIRNLTLPKTPAISSVNPLISWTDDSIPPDIYYIVLDGYTRSDVLEHVFGFDNSAFLEDLRQLGFYIAECAQSNYTRTSLSLSSTFNMEYIDTFKSEIKPDEKPAWLKPYMKHGVVRQQLEGLGYQTIVFKNPWEQFLWEDAAIVYRSNGAVLLSPFDYLLLRTTVARAYLDLREAESRQLSDYVNYEDTRFALEQLPNVSDIPGPKFVFVHLVIPHAPFVFGPNGEKVDIPYDADAGNVYTEEDGIRGHTYAVTYINKRMLEIIPKIIRGSKTPPIIVIAGDHGTPRGGSENAVRILASFFAPAARSHFYKTITPVNVFRIVFDTYFNGSFGLLPDISYFSALGQYFNFVEMPNVCDETD
jgi:hypothetical protein